MNNEHPSVHIDLLDKNFSYFFFLNVNIILYTHFL